METTKVELFHMVVARLSKAETKLLTFLTITGVILSTFDYRCMFQHELQIPNSFKRYPFRTNFRHPLEL